MEDLHKIREAILNSVQNLTDDQLNKVIAEGSWSIAQVLNHLYIMEDNVVHQIQRALKREAFEEAKPFPLNAIADRTKKISAPDFLMPSDNFQTSEELKVKLATSRAALEKLVQETDEEELNRKTLAHRRFGVLTLSQWIALVGYHEKRHLGQIEEIKETLI